MSPGSAFASSDSIGQDNQGSGASCIKWFAALPRITPADCRSLP